MANLKISQLPVASTPLAGTELVPIVQGRRNRPNHCCGYSRGRDTSPRRLTTLTTTGNSALGDAEATDTHAIKGATTVLANSASAALTVTNTGAGNSFVVEDSATTDASPFMIDNAGLVGMGRYSPVERMHFGNSMAIAWDGTSVFAAGTSGAKTFKVFKQRLVLLTTDTGATVFRRGSVA